MSKPRTRPPWPHSATTSWRSSRRKCDRGPGSPAARHHPVPGVPRRLQRSRRRRDPLHRVRPDLPDPQRCPCPAGRRGPPLRRMTMVEWFDEALLEDEEALARADVLLRPLAEAGARVRREVVESVTTIDEAVRLSSGDRPRAVIAAGPDSRLL